MIDICIIVQSCFLDVMKLIEDSDCDELSKRRVTEEGETPGALWHIYHAQDADKMRDLLNKVSNQPAGIFRFCRVSTELSELSGT